MGIISFREVFVVWNDPGVIQRHRGSLMLGMLEYCPIIISAAVYREPAFLFNRFVAEQLREAFETFAISHARSIWVVLLTARPMDHIITDNIVELWVSILVQNLSSACCINILGRIYLVVKGGTAPYGTVRDRLLLRCTDTSYI